MQIAIVQNNQVVRIGDYKEIFNYVSFPSTGPDDGFLAENSALRVNVFKEYDAATQKLVAAEPYVENGWVYTVNVASKTQEEIDADNASKAARVRAQRNKLLSDTDWRFRSDMNPTQEWIDYCQALRDITGQAGFPSTVEWPAVPGTGV